MVDLARIAADPAARIILTLEAVLQTIEDTAAALPEEALERLYRLRDELLLELAETGPSGAN